jgi:hypothetical protein
MPDLDPYEELEKLSALKEKGILTEEEFTIRKSEIMEAMSARSSTAVEKTTNTRQEHPHPDRPKSLPRRNPCGTRSHECDCP